jgi:hypothetical protein
LEDIVRTDVREREWKDVNWMHLVPDRNQWQAYVNMAMNLQVL